MPAVELPDPVLLPLVDPAPLAELPGLDVLPGLLAALEPLEPMRALVSMN